MLDSSFERQISELSHHHLCVGITDEMTLRGMFTVLRAMAHCTVLYTGRNCHIKLQRGFVTYYKEF